MTVEEFTTEEIESEVWKPIPGFERYSASTLGRIRSEHSRRRNSRQTTLKPRFNRRGPYYQVNLNRGGKGRRGKPDRQTFTVHRLIALTFLGPRPPGLQINHKDAYKLNNRAANLEYVTPLENTRHALGLGLIPKPPKGVALGISKPPKLNAEQVADARLRHQKGESCAAIGRSLQVSDRTICSVIHKQGAYTN